ncbi:MAG: AAA family ATPase [Firmicutes bacterium]|nr:AAA family ATPase [Bacillota bacterium]
MSSVAWRRLELAGFGRFAGRVRLELEPGLNVHVAPNEGGKSTLLAGLLAVLFGLPASSDPERFGQARYQNWDGPSRFEGELEFAAGGSVYLIRRNFATHWVRVSRRSGTSWEDIVSEEHNPSARRRAGRFDRFLRETLGVASRDLYLGAFVLAQPLPEERVLDHEVQQLISGAGTASYRQALDRLVDELRQLTRASRDLGVTGANARKDGLLEKLDRDIAQLRAAIDGSRHAVDSLQAVQVQVRELEERAREQRVRLAAVEKALAAASQWRALATRRRDQLQRYAQLLRAWEGVRDREAKLDAGRRRLEREFPEMALADPRTGELLEQLVLLEERIAAARNQARRDVDRLRAQAEQLAREWREFSGERDRLALLQERLSGQYAVFEQAAPEELHLFQACTKTRQRLLQEVESAELELARCREQRATYQAEEDRFRRSFADVEPLAGLGENPVEAVDARLEAFERLWQVEEQLKDARRRLDAAARRSALRRTGILVAGAVLAVIAGLGVYGVYSPAAAAVAAVAVLALAAGWAVRAGTLPRDAVRTVRGLEEEANRLQSSMNESYRGPLATAAPHELAAWRERLLARQQQAAVLEQLRQAVPSQEAERELAIRAARAREALAAFDRATGPARERFGQQVEEAYRDWVRIREEAQALLRSIEGFCRRHFNRADAIPERVPAASLAGPWAELAGLFRAAGFPAATAAEVGERLDQLPVGFWDEAVRHVESGGELVQWQAEAASLREQLGPVLAAVGGDASAARERVRQWQLELDELDRLEGERAGLLAAHGVQTPEELHELATAAGNGAAAFLQEMERLRQAHPELPEPEDAESGARAEERLERLSTEQERLRAELAADEERLRTLWQEQSRLAGGPVVNIAQAEEELRELIRRREAVALEAAAVARAHQELVAAVREFQAAHRCRLAESAGRYLARFTGRPVRVMLDEEFRVSVGEPSGQRCAVGQLSQGTRDQLYLALRLAIADLVAEDAPLPLLFDDPFVNCDAGRLERIREALESIARQRQILLVAHRVELSAWGRPARVWEESVR